jgi:hypothetical protein
MSGGVACQAVTTRRRETSLIAFLNRDPVDACTIGRLVGDTGLTIEKFKRFEKSEPTRWGLGSQRKNIKVK